MKPSYKKLEEELVQKFDYLKNEEMPTIRDNQFKEKPTLSLVDLLTDANGVEIESQLYKELENFVNYKDQSLPTDVDSEHKVKKKKYEIINLRVIDMTPLTNDVWHYEELGLITIEILAFIFI